MTQNKMIKVGITGGSGSGKTMFCDFLKEKSYPIIYADIISREVHLKYLQMSEKIKATFGEEFFDGEVLNRKKLGNRIFSNEEDRKKLESIVIPFIIKEIDLRFDEFENQGYKICFLDAPTLFENNLHKKMDYSILIYVDINIQINRIIKRDNISFKQAENMIKSQMNQDEKAKLADFIIINNTTKEYAEEKILEIVKKIEKDHREKLDDCY
ncbi:MAG: dephospho-CoA kinase [Oscillospiraceae bacterium]|nr:dephospho-CoA kinase [Oscillospiraceae bacterium]